MNRQNYLLLQVDKMFRKLITKLTPIRESFVHEFKEQIAQFKYIATKKCNVWLIEYNSFYVRLVKGETNIETTIPLRNRYDIEELELWHSLLQSMLTYYSKHMREESDCENPNPKGDKDNSNNSSKNSTDSRRPQDDENLQDNLSANDDVKDINEHQDTIPPRKGAEDSDKSDEQSDSSIPEDSNSSKDEDESREEDTNLTALNSNDETSNSNETESEDTGDSCESNKNETDSERAADSEGNTSNSMDNNDSPLSNDKGTNEDEAQSCEGSKQGNDSYLEDNLMPANEPTSKEGSKKEDSGMNNPNDSDATNSSNEESTHEASDESSNNSEEVQDTYSDNSNTDSSETANGDELTGDYSPSCWYAEFLETTANEEQTHVLFGGGGGVQFNVEKRKLRNRFTAVINRLLSANKRTTNGGKFNANLVLKNYLSGNYDRIPNSKLRKDDINKIYFIVDTSGSVSQFGNEIIKLILSALSANRVEVWSGSEAHPTRNESKGLDLEYHVNFNEDFAIWENLAKPKSKSTVIFWGDGQQVNFGGNCYADATETNKLLSKYNCIWITPHTKESHARNRGNELYKLKCPVFYDGHTIETVTTILSKI